MRGGGAKKGRPVVALGVREVADGFEFLDTLVEAARRVLKVAQPPNP
jgi:hypothetical protein